MPDHIHLLLTPSPDISLEKAMQYIKGGFSFRLKSNLEVWQRSYDSRRILDAKDFAERTHYIHQNPARAHIVEKAEALPFLNSGQTACH